MLAPGDLQGILELLVKHYFVLEIGNSGLISRSLVGFYRIGLTTLSFDFFEMRMELIKGIVAIGCLFNSHDTEDVRIINFKDGIGVRGGWLIEHIQEPFVGAQR